MRTLFILLICFSSYAQVDLKDNQSRGKNTISVNLIGEGSILSGNYSRSFFFKNDHMIDVNVGIGFSKIVRLGLFANWGVNQPDPFYHTFPHHITYNFEVGEKKHYIELGLGGAYAKATNLDVRGYVFFPIAGYRLHPFRRGRVFLRVYASPLFTSLKFVDGHGGLMAGITF